MWNKYPLLLSLPPAHSPSILRQDPTGQLLGKRKVEQMFQLSVTFTYNRNTTKLQEGHSPGSQYGGQAGAKALQLKSLRIFSSPPASFRTEFPLQARQIQPPLRAADTPVPTFPFSPCRALSPAAGSTTLPAPARLQSSHNSYTERQRPQLLRQTEGLSARCNLQNLALQTVNSAHSSVPLGTSVCLDQSHKGLFLAKPSTHL